MLFKTLDDVWDYYDVKNRKGFDALDVLTALSSVSQGDGQEARGFEVVAFRFVPSRNTDERGVYYKFPETNLSPEIVSYWEKRAVTVCNPLLKMRYTGLVLDYKKRVVGVDPDYKNIKLANVEAIIDVVSGDYCKNQLTTLDYAARALKLANGFRNDHLKQTVAKAFYEAHKRIAVDDSKAGLWGAIMHSLIRYRKAFAPYEVEIVNENLDRLKRIEALALAEGDKTDSHAHTMEQQVDILCEYYHSIGEDERIEGFLDRLFVAMKRSIPARGGMWGQMMLERMQSRYRKYGQDRKANRLYVEISILGNQTIREMTRLEMPFQIDRKMLDKFIEEFLEGTLEEAMERYILHFIPIKEHEIKRRQEIAKEHPLLDMISTVNIDAAGNVINRIGVGKNAQEQKLHHSMFEGISVSGFFMSIVMDEIKDKKHLTVETLMGLFENCPMLNEDSKVFLEKGFDAYLAGNDIACCHILVPQFEAMIRSLIASCGGEIMHPAKDPVEGNEYDSLDSLLDSQTAKELFPEDIIEYFKVLFVSQAGWNIRNSLSHGLFKASSVNRAMSDRVVHAILILSLVKLNDKASPTDTPEKSE